jgi:hypothetical protein
MNNEHNNVLHPESEARLESYIRATKMAVPAMRVTKEDILRNTKREGNIITPSPYTRVIMSYQTLIKVLAPITAVVLIGGIAWSKNMQHTVPAPETIDSTSQPISGIEQKTDSEVTKQVTTPITTPKQSNAAVDSIVDSLLSDTKTETRDAKSALSDYQSSFSTSSALDTALNTDYAN